MQALFVEAPTAVLAERRRLGLDGRDEMWDGVLHVVPPAGGPHQELAAALFLALAPLARRAGLVPYFETGLFHSDDDYRVPDQLYCRPDQRSDRGAEGAEVVVEIRSPQDETYRKLPFYALVGVREVVVLHPGDGQVELFRAVEGDLRPVSADRSGGLRCDVLAVHLMSGRPVRLSWDGGSAEI